MINFSFQIWFAKFQKFDGINHRSVHKSKATKSGGIAIFTTLFIFSIIHYLKGINIYDFSLLIPLGIMFFVGVYDDFYNPDFKIKFLLQIIVAKILIDQGYVITNYHGFLGFQEVPWLLAQLSTIFVFLVIVNSINFIDGIDGLAITEVIKVIVLIQFYSFSRTSLHYLGIIIILGLIPLYYFNFKKDNKVFLGDAGSLFLGTLISVFIFFVLGSEFKFKSGHEINKVIFAIGLIIYPLFDLLRVFIIRISKKKSPFLPDQNHLHHLLINRGLSHFSSLIIIELISLSIFLIYIFK